MNIGHLDILLTQVDMEVLFDAVHARTMYLLDKERDALVEGLLTQADYYAMLAKQTTTTSDNNLFQGVLLICNMT